MWSRQAWPEGRNRLGPDALKTAQHLMGGLKADVDADDLLIKGPGGVSSDLCAFCPPLLAPGLDGLARGDGVTR